MKIAVGSKNPVKVAAVQAIAERIWPGCVVLGVSVPSGVSEMPMSDSECIAGATQRAQAARQLLDADLGFGLEGGVDQLPEGLMLVGWAVVADQNGRCGLGSSARVPLPAAIAARVLNGEELGPVMDDVVKQSNTKQQGGAAGILSAGLVDRQHVFETAVAYALAPLVSPQLYQ